MLWEKAKVHGISPIQIQLMLFIDRHEPNLCKVTHLSKEFNLTKPTVSDAVRVLHTKGYLDKEYSSTDSRSYSLLLTAKGKKLLLEISPFVQPMEAALSALPEQQSEALYSAITQLIWQLHMNGIIQVQRTCFGCRFYKKGKDGHLCSLLDKLLTNTDIRLDCAEFESKAA